jgi:cobalt/nickel transport protein
MKNLNIIKLIFSIILILLKTNTLKSHELWIEGKNYQLKNNEHFIANIKVGQDLLGESFPFINSETELYLLKNNKTKQILKQRDGDFPAIKQKINEDGFNIIYYQSTPEFLNYESLDKFKFFIKEYNLDYKNQYTSPPKESYQRFAKTIFIKNKNSFYKQSPELEFEILNLNNPFNQTKSKIKVVLNNKPFQNKKIIVFFRNDKMFEKKNYTTNTDGEVEIDTSNKGFYLVSSVDLRENNFLDKIKLKTDFYSRWASLTFEK